MALAKNALPDINAVRRAFGAKSLVRLDLRCPNIVGECPVAQALAPTGLQEVYGSVLTAQRLDETDDDYDDVEDITTLRKIAKVWGKQPKRMKYIDFCCHRHFEESCMVITLPERIQEFLDVFMDWKDGIDDERR